MYVCMYVGRFVCEILPFRNYTRVLDDFECARNGGGGTGLLILYSTIDILGDVG